MLNNSSGNRILYLDLLRVIAIIMMLQGHTIDALLANEFRNINSIFYSTWYFLRGFTGPIFMFTAGVVFIYLLTRKQFLIKNNPRINKGLKRGMSLLVIGYLLRYPTYTVFNFSEVTRGQWLTFFSVDALHLIGFGLLAIVFLEWLSSVTKITGSILFGISSLLILTFTPWVQAVAWEDYLPIPLAAYLFKDFGSIFPIFPYLQYIFLGAAIGSILNYRDGLYKNIVPNVGFIVTGFLLGILSNGIYYITEIKEVSSYSHSILTIGVLIFLNGLLAIISLKINSFPEFLNSLAKYSLIIYIIHIIILYGSPWSLGLYHLIGRNFTPFISILSTLIMIILMILISVRLDKFKVKMNISNLNKDI